MAQRTHTETPNIPMLLEGHTVVRAQKNAQSVTLRKHVPILKQVLRFFCRVCVAYCVSLLFNVFPLWLSLSRACRPSLWPAVTFGVSSHVHKREVRALDHTLPQSLKGHPTQRQNQWASCVCPHTFRAWMYARCIYEYWGQWYSMMPAVENASRRRLHSLLFYDASLRMRPASGL